jgi:membrane protease YdiL (CAAX protease family)
MPDNRWLAALVPSVVLVVYGNLATLAAQQPSNWPAIPALGHLLLVVLALLWAVGPARLSLTELGLGRAGWGRSALLGLGLGGLMALLVVGPLLAFRAIGWASSTPSPPPDAGALAQRTLELLLSTAVCEELWFRGLLQTCWVRLLGPPRGIFVTAVLFAAWHLVLWDWTLTQVTLQPALPLALTYPAGIAILTLGGVLFGWLRQVSGHLAGPIVAHWLIDLVLVGLVVTGWL